MPCQNTSELEGGGDSHQSSINTLPDISLVRHCTVLLPLGWELEADDTKFCLGCCSSLLPQLPVDVTAVAEVNSSDQLGGKILAKSRICVNQSRNWVVCPLTVLICESHSCCQQGQRGVSSANQLICVTVTMRGQMQGTVSLGKASQLSTVS